MESWQLIFIFFVILMIARIVPRLIRQRKMNLQKNVVTSDQPFLNEQKEHPFVKEAKVQPFEKETKPEPKDMLVLGEIIRGVKTFSNIQKRTGLQSDELDSILSSLENRGLMRVQEKKGVFGIKVKLIPTEKGFKEYDS